MNAKQKERWELVKRLRVEADLVAHDRDPLFLPGDLQHAANEIEDLVKVVSLGELRFAERIGDRAREAIEKVLTEEGDGYEPFCPAQITDNTSCEFAIVDGKPDGRVWHVRITSDDKIDEPHVEGHQVLD